MCNPINIKVLHNYIFPYDEDVFCVVAYGTLEARNVAINLLGKCWCPETHTLQSIIYRILPLTFSTFVLQCITGHISIPRCMTDAVSNSSLMVGQLYIHNVQKLYFGVYELLLYTGYKTPSCLSEMCSVTNTGGCADA